jgi:hypothetical protein
LATFVLYIVGLALPGCYLRGGEGPSVRGAGG